MGSRTEKMGSGCAVFGSAHSTGHSLVCRNVEMGWSPCSMVRGSVDVFVDLDFLWVWRVSRQSVGSILPYGLPTRNHRSVSRSVSRCHGGAESTHAPWRIGCSVP